MKDEKFLEFLSDRHENRGAMAALRAGLSDATQYRAIPILGMFGSYGPHGITYWGKVAKHIGAWFAFNPKEIDLEELKSNRDNLGTVCIELLSRINNEERISVLERGEPGAFTKRFLHLLQADGDEVFDRITPFIRRASRENIDVNYWTLLRDLKKWECPDARERIKQRWASGFWSKGLFDNSNESSDDSDDTSDAKEAA